jgi:NAD(P)-dependent dehydrogenase (short-subunit alcohol dehydrogenase family)
MSPPVAVVTGANRGIGRAIAVAFAAAGYAVLASARDPASLADTVAEAEKAATAEPGGGTVVAAAGDVQDEASMTALAAAAQDLGPVHAVVANAGVAGPTAPLHEITLARRAGSLIAISSMTGKRPLHGRTPYAAAKMGVIGLVRTLAIELGPYGVRVNAVSPGYVAGPRMDMVVRRQAEVRGVPEEQVRAEVSSGSPLGQMVSAQDVAAACVYLASAPAITGEDLNVTAGVVMY